MAGAQAFLCTQSSAAGLEECPLGGDGEHAFPVHGRPEVTSVDEGWAGAGAAGSRLVEPVKNPLLPSAVQRLLNS
jgi:hypothetical protein